MRPAHLDENMWIRKTRDNSYEICLLKTATAI
jgi:hypothetical protein